MTKLWSLLFSLLFVASVTAQDLTTIPNYLNGIRIDGTLLDDLDDLVIGGPEGEAGGDLEGNYPNPTIREGVVGTTALEDSLITPGLCGDATNIPQIEFDADGRGVSCDEIPIELPAIEDASITSAKLANTAVTPGVCGDATNVCQITVNAQGQVTLMTEEAISGQPTGGIGPEELESTAVTPGTCGDATNTCQVTTDEDGRITGQTEVAIDFPTESTAPTFTSLKLTPVVETTTCDMAYSNHKISPTGTTTCTLPAAATTTVGTYNFYHMNTNNLVIARTGSDVINDVAGNMAAVQGPLTHVQCSVIDTTLNWRCSVTAFAGYGSAMSTLCMGFAGGTNTSTSGSGTFVNHSLTCTIDAGKLTIGSELEICSGWQWTAGAAPPALNIQWKAGSVILNNPPGNGPTPLAGVTRNGEYCLSTTVGAVPGAAAATYNHIKANLATTSVGTEIYSHGAVSQPVNLATNGALVFQQASRWLDAGTGTSSITQQWMRVRGSGLLP